MTAELTSARDALGPNTVCHADKTITGELQQVFGLAFYLETGRGEKKHDYMHPNQKGCLLNRSHNCTDKTINQYVFAGN